MATNRTGTAPTPTLIQMTEVMHNMGRCIGLYALSGGPTLTKTKVPFDLFWGCITSTEADTTSFKLWDAHVLFLSACDSASSKWALWEVRAFLEASRV